MDRLITRSPSKTWIRIGIIAGAAAAVLLTLSTLLNHSSASTLRVAREHLSIATVTRGNYQDFIPVRGFVAPERTVYLDSVEGGRIEEIHINEGNVVQAGAPILRLSNTTLELDVIAREADVTEQITNLNETNLEIERDRLQKAREILEIDYDVIRLVRLRDRRKELAAHGLIPVADYESIDDEYGYQTRLRKVMLEAQKREAELLRQQSEQRREIVERLKLNLRVTRQKLENLTLRAPVTGQLTKLDAEIGQTKSSAERLGQIDLVEQLKVSALLDEFYLGRIQVGQHATFHLAGAEQEMTVDKVYPGVDNGQFRIDLTFNAALPPGLRTG